MSTHKRPDLENIFFPFTDANNLVLRFVLYYHAICNISDYVSYYIGLQFVLNHIPL